jgi:hypothetical protein
MQFGTIITALIVTGIVWGGFVFFLIKAIKYERVKLKNGEE